MTTRVFCKSKDRVTFMGEVSMSHILLQVTPMTDHMIVSHGNENFYADSSQKHCPALNGLHRNNMGLFIIP